MTSGIEPNPPPYHENTTMHYSDLSAAVAALDERHASVADAVNALAVGPYRIAAERALARATDALARLHNDSTAATTNNTEADKVDGAEVNEAALLARDLYVRSAEVAINEATAQLDQAQALAAVVAL